MPRANSAFKTTIQALDNRVTIEVATADFRLVRGRTVIAALCDEVAFWRDDMSVNPDREIVAALRPAMATVPGALLIGLSTPYRRTGVLFEAHRDHFGKAGDVLVVQAGTRAMNPTSVPEKASTSRPLWATKARISRSSLSLRRSWLVAVTGAILWFIREFRGKRL